MRKRIAIIMLVTIMLLFTACGHEHVWQAANCVSPKICPECGEVEGEALGHIWQDATCTESKVCTVCAITMGEPLGHDWVDADCITPKTCDTCGKTDGAALGHQWGDATCVLPMVCATCAAEEGSPLGHSVELWEVEEDSTCTEEGVEKGACTVCGEEVPQVIAKKEHTSGEWEVTVQPTPDEEGTRIKTCTVCGEELEKEDFTLSDEELEELYKKNCKTISYKDLARNPGDYEGEYVKFSGKIVQVCYEAESIFYYSSYRLATYGGYDNVVYIKIDNYGSGSRILEDDWITIYGKFDGLYTYETVMGSSVTIPCIVVEYFE